MEGEGPEMCRNRGVVEKGEPRLYNVAMMMLGEAIMLQRVRRGGVVFDTERSKTVRGAIYSPPLS